MQQLTPNLFESVIKAITTHRNEVVVDDFDGTTAVLSDDDFIFEFPKEEIFIDAVLVVVNDYSITPATHEDPEEYNLVNQDITIGIKTLWINEVEYLSTGVQDMAIIEQLKKNTTWGDC